MALLGTRALARPRVIRTGPGGQGPGPGIEGAVGGGPGDVGEAQVAAAGVGPQPGESLGQTDISAL